MSSIESRLDRIEQMLEILLQEREGRSGSSSSSSSTGSSSSTARRSRFPENMDVTDKIVILWEYYNKYPGQNKRRNDGVQIIINGLLKRGVKNVVAVPWNNEKGRGQIDLSGAEGILVYSNGEDRIDAMTNRDMMKDVQDSGVYWGYIGWTAGIGKGVSGRYNGSYENNISKTVFFPVGMTGEPKDPDSPRVQDSLDAIAEVAKDMKEFF